MKQVILSLVKGMIFLLMWTLSVCVLAQNITVRGTVTDNSGEPLIGVTVQVQGTTPGAVTDIDGNFSLPNVPANATLEISYVGMVSQRIAVNGRTTFNITLTEDVEALEEVVVVGYGVQKKRDITGAVVSYNSQELEKMPYTNITQALQGKIAGMAVSVTSSSAESGGASIQIRAPKSISAGNGPLIVLDGIPYDNPLTEINPNDIESIEVLKDASSAAIYGARASNGVILITTKKGKQGKDGKPVIKADVSYTTDYITKKVRYFTADEYWTAINEREQMTDLPTAEEVKNRDAGKSTDWQNLAIKNGERQQYNLSVSGSSEGIRYYFSGAWNSTKGTTLGDNFSRGTIRINLEGKVTDWMTIGTNTQLGRMNRDGVSVNYNFDSNKAPSPYTLAYNDDGSLKIFPDPKNEGLAAYGNILDPLLYDNTDITRSVITNNYVRITLPSVPGLSYQINTGITYRNRLDETYRPSTSAAGYADKGIANVNQRNYEDWIVDNILSYQGNFEKHHVSVTGLYSAQRNTNILHTKQGIGFTTDIQGVYGISSAATIKTGESFIESAVLSQMGRVNYNYDGKYLLTATVRRDGFSAFGSNRKFGVFPSVALGWNFSEEDWMKNIKWLSSGKLRLSYGKNGNQAISAYETMPSLSEQWYLDENNQSVIGYYPSDLGDSGLGWETTKSFNGGLDIGFFKGRISASFDMFRSNTNDLILNRVISPVNGTTSIKTNVGSTKSSGYEFALSALSVHTKDFLWTTDFNFSYNKESIVDVGVYDDSGKPISDVGNQWFIGERIGVLYNYKFDHILQEGETPPVSQSTAKPGYALVYNLNDEGASKDIINADDKTIVGYTRPSHFVGMTNTISYKGLTFTVFINGQFGKTADGDYNYWTAYNTTYKEFWTPETPDVVFPSNSTLSNPYNVRVWDHRNKTDFVKIQDVTLSYKIPLTFTEKMFVDEWEIYFNAKNLYAFTSWTWSPDPEFSRSAGSPSITAVLFGTKITF